MKNVNNFYIKEGQSAAIKINKKKDLLDVITDHRDQVSQYIKEKRLSIKKAEDLQAIVTYYNSLKESAS